MTAYAYSIDVEGLQNITLLTERISCTANLMFAKCPWTSSRCCSISMKQCRKITVSNALRPGFSWQSYSTRQTVSSWREKLEHCRLVPGKKRGTFGRLLGDFEAMAQYSNTYTADRYGSASLDDCAC